MVVRWDEIDKSVSSAASGTIADNTGVSQDMLKVLLTSMQAAKAEEIGVKKASMDWMFRAGASEPFWSSIGKTAADYAGLSWDHFFVSNLLPVTLGNIIGGTVLVGGVYWFVYLRRRESPS